MTSSNPSQLVRPVFIISDGTGITAETLSHSLLTQFAHIEFNETTLPYINTEEKARGALARINDCYQQTQVRPLVILTLVEQRLRHIFSECQGLVLDFFGDFVTKIEKEFKYQSSPSIGRAHGLQNYRNYMQRMEAVNYALNNDDGCNLHNYQRADLILVGVSRCGKTPTSLYLSMQHGLFVANYPLTDDELQSERLPTAIQPYRDKLFGLTIDPYRLQQIRHERRPNSEYAKLSNCQFEVKTVELLFVRQGIKYLDVTTRSVEEIATEIMSQMNLKRSIAATSISAPR
ncbi:MAG: pyruvate, water dikinase regulatory protein [Gammaproteobacteria bacterium]